MKNKKFLIAVAAAVVGGVFAGIGVSRVELPQTETTSETTEKPITKGIKTETETYYPLLLAVTETENTHITAEDKNGNQWQFESEDAYEGDLYSCIITDNGTPEDITDDEIETIRFAGEIGDYESETLSTSETLGTSETIVDMDKVVDFEATETGLQLYFEDGTGYYWER